MRERLAIAIAAAAVVSVVAQQTPPPTPDIPERFEEPTSKYDYVKRDVMIPMRDGVKLHTVIVVPRGARNAPLLLTRTPYNASDRAERSRSPHMTAALPLFDELFAADGYIRVYQDVRGKYKSEGEYVMTRPLRGPLNTSAVDHSTDAYDTIDWLVKNVPESNGRVGMVGSSYEGFTVVMALVNPHPALKAAVPRGRWSTAGWATTGFTTAPSARRTSTTSPTRPRSAARARTSSARATTTTRTSAAAAPPVISRRRPAWISSPGGEKSRSTLRTTRSGRLRRSTPSWRSSRSRCRQSGCRACGIRKTCGAPFTATPLSSRKTPPMTKTF